MISAVIVMLPSMDTNPINSVCLEEELFQSGLFDKNVGSFWQLDKE
jgi:hypothetical protein